MLDPIKIDSHQVSIDNICVTGDLTFLVILLGKEFSSPKRCFKCKLHLKVWLEHGHKIGEDQAINTFRLASESDSTGFARLGVKETPSWECVEVDKYICPILLNQIDLGSNVLYDLLDCETKYIENVSTTKQVARNSLSVIDASINENIILRQEFDISEDKEKIK